MGFFFQKKMAWRQAWREADVRRQTSAPPHLTVWRQAEQLSFHFSLSRIHEKTFQVHWRITEVIVFPGWGEVLVVTEREHFCAWVQQTRHKIESLPVLAQICDPPILHVLPDVFAYRLDTGMRWWHGKFSAHVCSAQPSLLNRRGLSLLDASKMFTLVRIAVDWTPADVDVSL